MNLPHTSHKRLKRIAVLFTLVLSISFMIIIPPTPGGGGEWDFITYWAASHLLIQGNNPYDATAIDKLEAEVRPEATYDLNSKPAWNPPWLLLTLAPLALLPFGLAVRIWILVNIICIVAAMYMVWEMYGQAEDGRGFIVVLGACFLFFNTFTLIRIGQISGLILISLVLVIWLIKHQQYFFAGAFMVMLTIKPHLTYLVLPILLIYALIHRRWSVFIGFIITILLSMGLTWLLYPDWLSAYFKNLVALPYNKLSLTTMGSFFWEMFGFPYLRYVGLLLIPLTIPLARSVDRLGLLTVLNIALVISLPFSPYGFSFDHILLLLAVCEIIIWLRMKKYSTATTIAIIAGLAVAYAIQYWLVFSFRFTYYSWWVWVSFVIMLVYLFALRKIYAYKPTGL